MSYTYHGESGLIPLAGETQRVIEGNVVIVEKDYAIRADRLENIFSQLAPGMKMPGTNYLIDSQPGIQIGADGFARIRLSGLMTGGLEQSTAIDSISSQTPSPIQIEWSAAITDLSTGLRRLDINGNPIATPNVRFTAYEILITRIVSKYQQRGPLALPPIIEPTGAGVDQIKFPAIDAVTGVPTTPTTLSFENLAWQVVSQTTTSVYDGRALQEQSRIICLPFKVRVSNNNIRVQYFLTTEKERVISGIKVPAVAKIGNLDLYYEDDGSFGYAVNVLPFSDTKPVVELFKTPTSPSDPSYQDAIIRARIQALQSKQR